MWISFAYTTDAVIMGEKSVTRRNWARSHAMKLYGSQVVDIYDKNPRIHGQNMGQIEILGSPYLQRTGKMTPDDYEREGLLWMERNCRLMNGQSPEIFFNNWIEANEMVYVVEFKLLNLTSLGMQRKMEIKGVPSGVGN